jgi:hypothetical protein
LHTVVIDEEEEEEEEEVDEALADGCDDVTGTVGRTVLLCTTVSASTGHDGLEPGHSNMSWSHGKGGTDRISEERGGIPAGTQVSLKMRESDLRSWMALLCRNLLQARFPLA